MLSEFAQHLTRATINTLTDPEKFLNEMRHIRRVGYAVNYGEWRDSVYGVASAITDSSGCVIAAIGVSGPADRFKTAQVKKFSVLTIAAAEKVSNALSGISQAGTQ
jgi:DNA-binding IclR family transcriptional regulator